MWSRLTEREGWSDSRSRAPGLEDVRSDQEKARLLNVPNFVSHRLGAEEEIETRATSCQVVKCWDRDALSSRTEAGALWNGSSSSSSDSTLAARLADGTLVPE